MPSGYVKLFTEDKMMDNVVNGGLTLPEFKRKFSLISVLSC